MAPQWLERNDHTTSGIGDYEAGDHARRHGNLLRVGRVAEADYPSGLIRVAIQEDEETGEALLLTDWIPWLTQRAGRDSTWWPPEVGEAVVVLAPSGELSQGVALPGMFSNDRSAPASRETVHRTLYEDGTLVEYDRENKRLMLDCPEGHIEIRGKTVTIHAEETLYVDAAGVGYKTFKDPLTLGQLVKTKTWLPDLTESRPKEPPEIDGDRKTGQRIE